MKFSIVNIYTSLVIAIIWMYLPGCDQERTARTPEPAFPGYKVEIIQSAGELYSTYRFLPLLGNLAKANDTSKVEILIISDQLSKGQKIAVDPVALLKYIHGSKEKQLIVAIPTNPKYQSIKISNLVDLSVKYAGIKRIIEQWYESFSGLGSSKILAWENKSSAINVLNDEIQN